MAKLTKFTLSPSGDLVYKSNGKLGHTLAGVWIEA